MKNNKKGFVGVAIVVIVALAIAGFGAYKVFYKAPPAEETLNVPIGNFPADYEPADHANTIVSNNSNWQTYSDTKYGIEFKYLKEWGDVLPHDEGGNQHVIKIAIDNNKASMCKPIGSPNCKVSPDINVFFIKDKVGLNSFISAWGKQADSTMKIYVDNIPTVSYTLVGPVNDSPNATVPLGYNKVILSGIQKSGNTLDDTFVEIAFTSPTFATVAEAKSYNTADFEKFLSTIKFTNPSSFDTSNWKTYTNEKYGFELTFPKTWGEIVVKENEYGIWFNSDKNEKGSIFYIQPMTEQEWKDCQEAAKTGIPPCATNFVARNATMIFNYNSASQDPSVSQEERLKEVPGILSTFKFTK